MSSGPHLPKFKKETKPFSCLSITTYAYNLCDYKVCICAAKLDFLFWNQARLKGILQHWQPLKFSFLTEWCSLKQKPPKSEELFHRGPGSLTGHFGNWQCRALWGREVSVGWGEPLKLCSIWQDMLEHPGLTAALLKISALKTRTENHSMQIILPYL